MRPETLQYRRDNEDLTRSLVADWRRIWPALDMRALDDTYPRWLVAASAVTGRHRSTSQALAADYLSKFSDAPIRSAPDLTPERFATSMRVTSVIAAKVATRNGETLAGAAALAFSASSRSASRLVLNAGRDTIRETTAGDSRFIGWQRVGAGGCDFCQMLIGRGAVYTEASADFLTHDGCHCSAEPVVEGDDLRDSVLVTAPEESEPEIGSVLAAASLSDDAIQAEIERLMEAGDFDNPRMDELAAELDGRDQSRERYAEEIARDEWENQRAADRAAGILRRPAGPSKAAQERALRDEYETWIEIQYVTADAECRGVLLSHDGKVERIRPRDLFTKRRASLKWASEELQEWFSRHPRMSFQEFRAGSTNDDPARAARARSANRGWEGEFG